VAAGEPRALGRLALAIGLVAGVLAAYAPVGGFDFINFDDHQYVTANPVVRGGLSWRGLGAVLTQPHAKLWHPLTSLSHMADVTLFGLRPGPPHLVNVVLHAASAAACFVVLVMLTGRTGPSAVTAMLFAWHPARVESVAWIAERKDVLSMLLAWGTLGAWIRYVRGPTRRRFAAALLLFAGAVLSKSMLVTLPGVLLLLDFWPLGRLGLGWRTLLREKLPFVALAAVCAAITYQASGGAVAPDTMVGPGQRLANAIVAYVRYLGLLAWPTGLAIFYPYRAWQASTVALAGATLSALTLGALAVRQRAPWVTMGWFWYVFTLFPVSGIVQAGSQSMADRFTYLPSVGIAIALVWSADALVSRRRLPAWALAAGAVALGALLLGLSRRQVMTWRDSETVFRHAIAVTGDNYLAQNQLGEALASQQRFAAAAPHYAESARLNPTYPEAQNNLGNAKLRLGLPAEAEPHFQRAIALDPLFAEPHNGLGTVLSGRGDLAGAVAEFHAALARRAEYPEALVNLGHALRRQGDFAGSADAYRRVVDLRPDWLDARLGLGRSLAGLGQLAQAEATLRLVVARAPEQVEAAFYLAALLLERGAVAEARAALGEVLRREPDFAEARALLARLDGGAENPPAPAP
jgi:tetratricopeptide (TPR) repeat protein